MLVTKDFVFIHTFRCGGTFINQFIKNYLEGVEIGYHLPYKEIPEEYRHLPVINCSRNPWDWYVSIYYHCVNFNPVMNTDTLVNIITNFKREGFVETTHRLVDTSWMGEQDILNALQYLPTEYNYTQRLIGNITQSDLREYFEHYQNTGLYSWLQGRMIEGAEEVYTCEVSTLANDFFRIIRSLDVVIPDAGVDFLIQNNRFNELQDFNTYIGNTPFPRQKDYRGYYTKEIQDLVAVADGSSILRRNYVF